VNELPALLGTAERTQTPGTSCCRVASTKLAAVSATPVMVTLADPPATVTTPLLPKTARPVTFKAGPPASFSASTPTPLAPVARPCTPLPAEVAVPTTPSPPPEPPEPAADVLRPVISPDTAFFWEGTARHELRIQRCGGCGTLRHPPGPMCPVCGFARPEYDVAAGTGHVYSYVVHHHPPVPGRQLPIVIVLVQLTEGVRMVGELLGTDPERVRIGLPVRVTFVEVDGDLTLPAWQEDQP